MAGHTRTVATGRSWRTGSGKSRRVREHLPPGEADKERRRKQHQGARTLATDRIKRERNPMAQLAHALAYVRSASAKYRADADVTAAVQTLLDVGDRIYTTGTRTGGK